MDRAVGQACGRCKIFTFTSQVMLMDRIEKLCRWYEAQCGDEWEEDHGFRITTLDNPGWSLKIDLDLTPLADKTFEPFKREGSDTDWVFAWRKGMAFEAAGGPLNLGEMIDIFLAWAT